MTFGEASARIPINDPRFADAFALVDYGISGTRSPLVVGCEVALSVVVSIGLILMASRVVDRRRPY